MGFTEPAQRAAQVDVEVGDVDAGEVAGEGGFAAARRTLEKEAKVRFLRVGVNLLHLALGWI